MAKLNRTGAYCSLFAAAAGGFAGGIITHSLGFEWYIALAAAAGGAAALTAAMLGCMCCLDASEAKGSYSKVFTV